MSHRDDQSGPDQDPQFEHQPRPQAPTSPYAANDHGQPVYINNTYIVRNDKNMVLTYVLWFFLGSLGIHKFYLGHNKAGITYLVLSVIGWATSWLLVGFAFLAVVGVLLLVDIFLIPGHVRQANASPQYGARQ